MIWTDFIYTDLEIIMSFSQDIFVKKDFLFSIKTPTLSTMNLILFQSLLGKTRDRDAMISVAILRIRS